MGRTGRKRNGRIVVLVSEGKEEQVRTVLVTSSSPSFCFIIVVVIIFLP
jgi:hypothetical protein